MKFLVVVLVTFIIYRANCSNVVDFNFYVNYLTKYSQKITLESCFDSKHSLSSSEPCRLADINHNEHIWSEENIKDYLFSSFLFANLTEVIRNKQTIESRTNIRRFVKQMDQYTDETKFEIEMPQFLR